MNSFQKILESFSLSDFCWNVVAGLVGSLIVALFNKLTFNNKTTPSPVKVKSLKRNVINGGTCLVFLISIFLFVFLTIFNDAGIAKYLDYKLLINSLLISYGVFFIFHLVNGLKLIRYKQSSFSQVFQDSVFMLLLSAMLTLALLYFKLAVESLNGITDEEGKTHLHIVNNYMFPLAQLVLICAGMLLPGMIFKIVKIFYRK